MPSDAVVQALRTLRDRDCPYLGNYKLGYDAGLEDAATAVADAVLADVLHILGSLPVYEGHPGLAGYVGGLNNRPAVEFRCEALAAITALGEK